MKVSMVYITIWATLIVISLKTLSWSKEILVKRGTNICNSTIRGTDHSTIAIFLRAYFNVYRITTITTHTIFIPLNLIILEVAVVQQRCLLAYCNQAFELNFLFRIILCSKYTNQRNIENYRKFKSIFLMHLPD